MHFASQAEQGDGQTGTVGVNIKYPTGQCEMCLKQSIAVIIRCEKTYRCTYSTECGRSANMQGDFQRNIQPFESLTMPLSFIGLFYYTVGYIVCNSTQIRL